MATRRDMVDLEQRLEAAMEMKLDAEARYDQALGRLEDTVGKLKSTTQRLDDACVKVKGLHHKIQVIREYSESLMRRRRLALAKAQAELEAKVLAKRQEETLAAAERERAFKHEEHQEVKGDGACNQEDRGVIETTDDKPRTDGDSKPRNRRKRGRSKSKRETHSRGGTPVRAPPVEPSKKDDSRGNSPVHGLQPDPYIVHARRNSRGNSPACGLYAEPYSAVHTRKCNFSRGNSPARGLQGQPYHILPIRNNSSEGNSPVRGLQPELCNVQVRRNNSSRGNSPARALQAQPYSVPLRRNSRGCSPSRSLQVQKYKLEHSRNMTPVLGPPVVASRGKSPMRGFPAEQIRVQPQASLNCELKSEFEALTRMKATGLCADGSSGSDEVQSQPPPTPSSPAPNDPSTASVELRAECDAASRRRVDNTKVYIDELSQRLTRAQSRTVKAESAICFLQMEIGRLGFDLTNGRAAQNSNDP